MSEIIKILDGRIKICDKHLQRLAIAIKSLKTIIPLNKEGYRILGDREISLIDQMSYRFTKLQDAAGRLLRTVLLVLQEDIENSPFIDVLNRSEKLKIIESAEEWIKMRELRNILSHEYSEEEEEIAQGINQLHKMSERLCVIYSGIKDFMKKGNRFNVFT